MTVADLEAVMAIDALSLPVPWPRSAHERELSNRVARYLVLAGTEGAIRGYGGLWAQVDELHIIVMAVHPDWRRRGLGERILRALIRSGMALGCVGATLEVRAGNHAAQALYGRFGFREAGLRRRYYGDNDEDALIMSTPPFADPGWQRLWERIQAQPPADDGDLGLSAASAPRGMPGSRP